MSEKDNNFIHSKYSFKDTSDWKLGDKKNLFLNGKVSDIQRVQYRPFDYRFTYYPLDKINEIIPRGDSRWNLMKNFLNDEKTLDLFQLDN